MQGLNAARSEMSLRKPQSAIMPLGFTQIPGAASQVAASPDGSAWVLGNSGPANGDQGIYHLVNGTFVNVPGAARRIAVGPDNTPWVLNSAGGIYHLVNGVFTGIAGGASELSVGSDGSLYVISNAPPGPYGSGIYHYVNGTWTQLPGAAVRIAASWDTGSYNYNVVPGGFYVINAQQSLFYWNPSSGFTQIPGAAIQLAPTTNGGLFALGLPNSPNGNPIYYNDLSTGTWTQQAGAGVAIAVNSSNVYVIGAAGGIYVSAMTPTTTPTAGPTSLPANLYPMFITNNSQYSTQPMNVYVYGTATAGSLSGQIVYLTAASGGNLASVSGTIPPISLASGGEIDLPFLNNARIYIALGGGTLGLTGTNTLSPYQAGDPSINTVWDFLEYTWTASAPFDLDLSQVDAIGIPMSFHWAQAGGLNTPEVGLMPNAITKISSLLTAQGGSWPNLIQPIAGKPYPRLINPSHAILNPDGTTFTPAVPPFDSTYMDPNTTAVYSTYRNTDLVISSWATGFLSAPGVGYDTVANPLYGRVSGPLTSPTLTFYAQPNMGLPVIGSITGFPSTYDVFANAGVFTNVPAGLSTVMQNNVLQIGRIVSVGLDRGTFPSSTPSLAQPVCQASAPGYPGWGNSAALAIANGFYGGPTPPQGYPTNWYSAFAHANAYSQAVYGFADDDECNFYASNVGIPMMNGSVQPQGSRFVVTINPF
jgi:hypothetical protein